MTYTLDEILRMRRATRDLNYGLFGSKEDDVIEAQLNTYLRYGVGPDELEIAAKAHLEACIDDY